MKIIGFSNKLGIATMGMVFIVIGVLTIVIPSITLWYTNIHKKIDNNGINPLGASIAQDRVNDVLNRSFYENYNKAQKHQTDEHIIDGDGNIVYSGDKYDVSTEYSNASTCYGELCYLVTVRVKEKGKTEEIYSSSETILESQSGRGVPIGTILPFAGNLSAIPYGWEPYKEMDDKYSKGAKDSSDMYETGGQKEFALQAKHIPPLEFTVPIQDRLVANGAARRTTKWVEPNGKTVHANQSLIGVNNGEDYINMDGAPIIWNYERLIQFGDLDFYVTPTKWKNTPFVMEPKFYKIGYIIKVKEIK